MKKVFLGGTVDSNYRELLIPMLKIDYFNPIIKKEDWNEEWQKRENQEKQDCDFCLYVISKEMTGWYSIAEVTDDSNKRPEKTIFCYLEDGFNIYQLKSLKAIGKLIEKNGGQVFNCLEDVAKWVNNNE